MTVETTETIRVGLRYFAAAQAAAGSEAEQLTVRDGTTVDDLVEHLGERHPDLAKVLPRCSFLYDGVAVRDRVQPLRPGVTIDVLPPFAGG